MGQNYVTVTLYLDRRSGRDADKTVSSCLAWLAVWIGFMLIRWRVWQSDERLRWAVDSAPRFDLAVAHGQLRPDDLRDIIAFSALTLLVGRQEGHPACKKLSGGMLAWLSVWSEVQACIRLSWCHCHSLSLASVKSRLVLPFWYRLARVVPDKEPLNGCVCVCVCVTVCVWPPRQISTALISSCRHYVCD